jgi:hypothetical protein
MGAGCEARSEPWELRLSKEPSRGAGSPQRTKAVVIVHNGRVIAERYARVDEPAPVAAGSNPSDPRHAITVEELMRMASGLDLDEEDAGIGNPSDQMLYLQRDMAAFAEAKPLKAEPGKRFSYSSGNTQILSSIVRSDQWATRSWPGAA